jgi:hypothetical protein
MGHTHSHSDQARKRSQQLAVIMELVRSRQQQLSGSMCMLHAHTSQWPAAAQTQPTAGRPPVTGQRTKPRRRLLLARTWCGSHEILWRPRRQSLPLLLRSRATVFPVPCRGRSVLCCVLSLIPEDERWCFRSVKMAVTCPLYRRKVICLGVPSSSARAPRSACVVLLCPR